MGCEQTQIDDDATQIGLVGIGIIFFVGEGIEFNKTTSRYRLWKWVMMEGYNINMNGCLYFMMHN